MTIVDNPVPELEKIFRVELYNAEGGGEKSKLWSEPFQMCCEDFFK